MSRERVGRIVPYVEYDEVQAACSDCGRSFHSEESLAEHRQEAHSGLDGAGDRPMSARVGCSVCSATFRTTAALQEHNRKAHSN